MRLPKSLRPRRPSAPMVVALTALFFAIGGVGYAAVSLPRNSVGNAQLQNGSVGNWKLKSDAVGAKKIINGSVGAKQVDSSQVQLRVASACSTGAISAVGLSGSVTCTPTVGNEYGSNTAATTLGASATQVATQSLAAGSSYLVMAYPHVVISGTAGAASTSRSAARCRSRRGRARRRRPTRRPRRRRSRSISPRRALGGRDDPARAAGGVVDERPAGDRELHRHAHAVDPGTDRRGRHHDQRDPDGQQQLIPSQGAAAGLDTGCRGRPRARGVAASPAATERASR